MDLSPGAIRIFGCLQAIMGCLQQFCEVRSIRGENGGPFDDGLTPGLIFKSATRTLSPSVSLFTQGSRSGRSLSVEDRVNEGFHSGTKREKVDRIATTCSTRSRFVRHAGYDHAGDGPPRLPTSSDGPSPLVSRVKKHRPSTTGVVLWAKKQPGRD